MASTNPQSAVSVTSVDLSVIIPTYNESGNVAELINKIAIALQECRWEIIFVDDDSPDGTAAKIREISRTEPRVRCIKRLNRRGLASACVEGILSSNAHWVAVMDADLQHDPSLLKVMHEVLQLEPIDLVIGSRYLQGGGVGEWDTRRAAISRFATKISTFALGRTVSDPMSGYFMIRRVVFDGIAKNLSSLGFKILFDIIASSPPEQLKIKEIPYQFGVRQTGESKLGANVAFEFLILLLEKKIGKYIPVRFLTFAAIGALGVGVHFAILTLLINQFSINFTAAQTLATLGAMVFNFSLNNTLTYAGQSLTGAKWLKGLLTFSLACSVGAFANIGISSYLFSKETTWQLAAFLGICLSSVWNYAVTSRYTWGVK